MRLTKEPRKDSYPMLRRDFVTTYIGQACSGMKDQESRDHMALIVNPNERIFTTNTLRDYLKTNPHTDVFVRRKALVRLPLLCM